MARIPDELLQRVRQEVSLERLAESRGVELRRHGADLIGRCPFHDDREPSLVVTPGKNLWHCLGACQTGGSPIDWVMKAEGVSFRHAVEILRADFFPTSPSLDGPPKQTTVPQLASPLESEASDQELLGQVIDYYHQTLKESPEALAYLERRGLVHPELVDRFKLGYANRTLGYRLPAMNRKAGQEIRTRLQKLGVLRDSGHEHLNGSLVIPILGEGRAGDPGELVDRQVLGAYGRKLLSNLRTGTPMHLYLPGPHRGIFNVDALKASKDVILCEALIDALTFWCAGFRNVTSSYGVEGFTHDHLAAFKAYGTEHVLIAYDRDDAGDGAAERLSKKLMAEGIACSRIQFPKGMDANDYARKVQPAEKALGVLVRSAAWLGNGNARRIGGVADATSPSAPVLCTNEQPAPLAAKEESSEESSEKSPSAAEEESPAREPAVTPPRDGLLCVTDDVALFSLGDRRYRVVGLSRCRSLGSLRVSLRAERDADLFAPPSPIAGWFQDSVDLCLHRQRQHFEKEAAREMGVKEELVRWDLGFLLRTLEKIQEERLVATLHPRAIAYAMTEAEREAALELGRSKDLLGTILEHYDTCGVVGEVVNKLALYLSVVSRKLDRPLAVVIRSSSAAGKSALMDAILAFLPKEEREKYSALTENSLFYFEGKDFKHKVLALVEEEGAQRASYALKLLQSEGEITIASTGKDAATGKLVTREYRVEGPVMILLTSTAVEIDEELLNRCLVLTVDEGREQTRAIHRLQRQAHTLEGLKGKAERDRLLLLHQNFQRLLRPLFVHNPYAQGLTFLDEKTRTRRDHTKYLALIDAVALLHQHQRPVHSLLTAQGELEYIEATLDDVALANGIASEILGRSLDELPPQTRRLLLLLETMVEKACGKDGLLRADYRFSRRDVRLETGWGDTQLRIHLDRLVSLEYLLVHRGGRGQSFVYELLYGGEGQDGARFLLGLIDAEKLGQKSPEDPDEAEYDGDLAGSEAEVAGENDDLAGPSRPLRGPIAGGWRGGGSASGPFVRAASGLSERESGETALIPVALDAPASYSPLRRTPRNGTPNPAAPPAPLAARLLP